MEITYIFTLHTTPVNLLAAEWMKIYKAKSDGIT